MLLVGVCLLGWPGAWGARSSLFVFFFFSLSLAPDPEPGSDRPRPTTCSFLRFGKPRRAIGLSSVRESGGQGTGAEESHALALRCVATVYCYGTYTAARWEVGDFSVHATAVVNK